MLSSGTYGGEAQVGRDRRRHQGAQPGGDSQLAVGIGAPAVRHAIQCHGAGVVAAGGDAGEVELGFDCHRRTATERVTRSELAVSTDPEPEYPDSERHTGAAARADILMTAERSQQNAGAGTHGRNA
jgi:hypothetical protein